MKKILALLLMLTFIVATPVANAQILSSTAHVEGTIDLTAKMIFSGKTQFSGELQGYPLDNPLIGVLPEMPEGIPIPEEYADVYALLRNLTIYEKIDIYPILSNVSTFTNIDEVIVFNINTNASESFSNVELTANNAPILLGLANGSAVIDSTLLNYAVSTVLSFEINEVNTTFFISVSQSSELQTHCTSEIGLIGALPTAGPPAQLTIIDKNDSYLYNITDSTYFIIKDKDFFVSQRSSFHLLPIAYKNSPLGFQVSVSPADPQFFDVISVIENLTTSFPNIGGMDIPDVSEIIGKFEPVVSGIAPILNGAMLIIAENGTFNIDGTEQFFSNINLARGEQFDIIFSTEDDGEHTALMQGDFKLVFLGDHFYTSQAPESESGVAVPIIIIAVWVLAAGIFILFHFFIKKEVDEGLDTKIKKFALIIHVILLIIAFILLDVEINYQLGMSVFGTLSSMLQGTSSSLIPLAIVAMLQLGTWSLGCLCLGLPIHLMTNQTLKLLGIGKGGKGIGKGVGALFIWIFAALYLKLIINIVLWILQAQGISFTNMFG